MGRVLVCYLLRNLAGRWLRGDEQGALRHQWVSHRSIGTVRDAADSLADSQRGVHKGFGAPSANGCNARHPIAVHCVGSGLRFGTARGLNAAFYVFTPAHQRHHVIRQRELEIPDSPLRLLVHEPWSDSAGSGHFGELFGGFLR